MLTPDEIQRIRRIQAGDQTELEFLLTEKKHLVNYAARPYFLKGADESDLVQEAIIGLVSAAMTFRVDENDDFDGYARMIIKRKLINAVKLYNRKKHSGLSDSAPLTKETEDGVYEIDLKAAEEDPIDRYVTEEEHRGFYEAAAKILTEAEFSVLRYYLQGYSYREIAEQCNITAKKADNVILQIKKKIKRKKELFLDVETD